MELKQRGYKYIRLNTEDFPQRVQIYCEPNNPENSFFKFPKQTLTFSEIKSVWYRRPVDPVPHDSLVDPIARQFATIESKESLEGALDLMSCFFVSKPYLIRRAENKLKQLEVASAIGFKIPQTIITNLPERFVNFYRENNETIVKPIRMGRLDYPENLKLIYTNVVKEEDLDYSHYIKHSPTLFQELIQKDKDLRLTIIGREIFAVEIHPKKRNHQLLDWRRNIEDGLDYENHELPSDISRRCLKLMDILGVNFSAMDFILSSGGEYCFLEMNPNGQWAWIQDVTGLPMRECLADLLNKGRI